MALEPVVLQFLAQGMPDIQRAFRGVEQIVTQSERTITRSAERGSQAQARFAERGAAAASKAAAKGQTAEKTAADTSAKEKERIAERSARRLLSIRERSATMAGQLAAKQASEEARIAEQSARRVQGIRDRSATMAGRLAAKQAADTARIAKQEENESKGRRRQFVNVITGAGGHAVRAGGGRVFDAARNAAGYVTQLGGGFGIGGSVERSARNSGQLEDILNSGVNRNSKIQSNWTRKDASELTPEIQSTAIKYGMERSDVQQGLGSFTGVTGDLETARKLLPQMAELSRATGTKFDELAQAGGNVGNAFEDIADSGKKAEKIMEVLRTLAGQGKAGNVELRDQAVQAAKVIASAGKYEGDNAENITKLGAIMQASRGGGGAWNAASAATAITAFTGTFGKGARREAFKSEGISINGADGKVRAPEQIIAESVDKTGGDIGRMNKLFGSVMSDRATAKYVDTWRKAEGTKKGSGKQAILDEISSMTKGVAMSKGEVTDAARKRTGALDARMASAREQFDKAVEERLIPSLLQLVPVIEKIIPQFVDLHAQAMPALVELIKTFADFAEKNKDIIRDLAAHPVGTLIGIELAKSIGSAAIGEGVKTLLLRLIGGGGSGGSGAGAGAGAGLGAPIVATIGAAGVVGVNAQLGYEVGKDNAETIKAKLKSYKAGDRSDRSMSPEQAEAALKAAQVRMDSHGGVLEQVGNLATSPFVDASNRDYKQYKADQGLLSGKEDIQKLITAIKENTAATKGSTSGGSMDPATRSQPITNRATK